MIDLIDINKNFGEIKALNSVTVSIPETGVIGLLGPNGAGKTTLMRVLVGFLSPSKGKIVWNKKTVETKSIGHRKKIGYLPESNPLYSFMNVSEYLNFIGKLKQVGSVKNEIVRVVAECGLKEVIGQRIETLSKGYKQRVGLAAAIMGDPKLLILDEPTSGLDPKQIVEIRKLIKKLSKGRLVMLSTHILPEAMDVCSRLIMISRGKIVLNEVTKSVKNLEKKFILLTS